MNVTPKGNIDIKNYLTDTGKQGYYLILSQKLLAVKSYRYPMAFFMPKNCLTSHVKRCNSIKHIILSQGKTIISIASKLLTAYDGATLQNKKALWRICKAVANSTESEPHHPINNSVVLTQKLLGGLSMPNSNQTQNQPLATQAKDLTPIYAVFKNGEPIFTDGVIKSTSYRMAYILKQHLQAVSDDSFTIERMGAI